ncbi:phosphonate ABC transporter ATP-binding protein [Candidatus Mycoplasma mahonii]|uniref:phosphonate ABC transporter ATP-binding protein n=1 Tax=Candidatus Mycoplasma mahonii TaxID=3004105 RepID=UPI0026F020AB|nr:phosphonate ABC transporter ATP-binding protein [Candidatus Mycoplasma mahonii]WKX02461.1 phosphonate ABC transporter ATP-binding protein [Candidatus Mycoplasma mahonii]
MNIKKWNIQFEDVGLIYPNGYDALRNINLKILEGEFVGIIGLSGAGKTTLLKSINKISKITSGNIIIGNIENQTKENAYLVKKLKGKMEREYKTHIGMVFQRYNLLYGSKVITNVLSAKLAQINQVRALLGIFKKEEKMLALDSLAQVGILENAYVRAENLSGGQMQRVALARTIAQGAKVILADEPVGALDPIMAKSVMDSFLRINTKQNKTIIINLHHVDLALQYTDRIIGVKNGEIVFDGLSTKVDLKVLKKIYGSKLEGFDEKELKEIWRKRKVVKEPKKAKQRKKVKKTKELNNE